MRKFRFPFAIHRPPSSVPVSSLTETADGERWMEDGRRIMIVALTLMLSLPAHALHVLIDPGHGGHDNGAVRGGVKESVIALKVSQILAEKLRADSRFEVSMTRNSDESVSLSRRTQIAKENRADIFLSVHLNSSTDGRAHGKEFYFQNQLPADEEALFLASRENAEAGISSEANGRASKGLSAESDIKLIMEDLGRNHRIRSSSDLSKILLETWVNSGQAFRMGNRSIRQAPFHVVSNVNIPSVLVELGFLSHAAESQKLTQDAYQQALAQSLYDGLVKYKETFAK